MTLSKLQKLATKAARSVSTAFKQVLAPMATTSAVSRTIVLQGDYQFVDHIDTVDVDVDMGEHAWVMYQQPNHSFAASHFSILGEYIVGGEEDEEESIGEEESAGENESAGEEESGGEEESAGVSTRPNSFAPSHFSVLYGGSAFSDCSDDESSGESCGSSSPASSTFGGVPVINVVPPPTQGPESLASTATSCSVHSVRCASTSTSPSLSSSTSAPAPPTTDNFIFEGSYERDGVTYNTFVAADDDDEDDPFSADPFAQATVKDGELVPISYEPVPDTASKASRHHIRGRIARLVGS